MIIRLLLYACLIIGISFPVSAQRNKLADLPTCVTPDLTDSQRQSLKSEAAFALQMKKTAGQAATGITYVPIRPHIFRSTNGSGGMSLAKMNNVMALANSYYLSNGSGIQFYFCGSTPDYINDDNLYNGFTAFNETSVNSRDVTNAMNLYYVHAFTQNNLGGYAYFPANQIGSTRAFILDEDNEADLGNRLLPHELGHNFSLFHTFGNSSNGTTELVTRGEGANCTTAGDLLCDTPADPYGLPDATTDDSNGCEVYTGTATDPQGNAYAPSTTNLMSYYFPCTHDFTPGQYNQLQAGLALRQNHTAYSLGCPANPVTAVSNVAATISNSSVLLTWQDNATNEMGYFIERSTAPGSNFVPVGGVAPNSTTYTDSRVAGLTTYYYRIRPSNATTNGLSATISITTPSCRPTFTNNCSDGDGLSQFAVNGTVLSQNSGCSSNGFGSFTAVSTTLLAGQTYSLSGTLLSTAYPEGVTIWADLNRNGIYETSQNEQLFQTPTTVTEQFSGSFTLPANLSAGPLSIRVVVAYSRVPNDPCGTYSYGEAEDYRLQIVNPAAPADLSLLMQVSTRTPAVNQPVSVSLTVRNSGPNDATDVSWQNYLPTGLSFVAGEATVINSGTVLSGTVASLPNGASATFVYQLRPTQSGTYINAAQVLSSNQPDPDSEADSGTADGQDDTATVDIRTSSATNVVYSSPNPRQSPLPAVVGNQPPPDPAKADLSLSMAVSNRTPALGQSVSLTVTVSNAGGLAATNVSVRDTLRGLTLLTPASDVAVVGSGSGFTIIQGTIASIAAGSSAQLIFRVATTTSGFVTTVAQIWSAGTADPDSTPGQQTPAGNTLNGEDDIARVDLRVGTQP